MVLQTTMGARRRSNAHAQDHLIVPDRHALAGRAGRGRPARAQTTFLVTNTADSGPGSLRQAINDADGNGGPETIAFNIPPSDPGYGLRTAGVWTIQPLTPLPDLLDGGALIDGLTQTANQGDTNPNGAEIEIYGANISSAEALFNVRSNGNTIQGLTIDGALVGADPQPGIGVNIDLVASGNTVAYNYIGLDSTGEIAQPTGVGIVISGAAHDNLVDANVISGNAWYGIGITGAGTDNNQVRRNYIGLSSWGSNVLPNGQAGILVQSGAASNVIGGQESYRNMISGNTQDGVVLDAAAGTQVTFNYVGVGLDGTGDMGNGGNGVSVAGGSQGNFVNNNVIAGNNRHGVWIDGSGTTGNYVSGNVIGADASATTGIVNGWHGVAIYDGASGNAVLGNLVASSGWSGVAIIGSNSNTVHGNSIGTNAAGAAGLGNGYHGVVTNGIDNIIEFNTIAYNGLSTASNGVQIGDPTALDNRVTRNSIYANGNKGIALVNGGNNNMATPTIGGATCSHVEGVTCPSCTIEVFSDTGDEGAIFEGTAWVDDVSGFYAWDGSLHGPHVTVTATDGQGNTSEFSAPWTVGCYRVFLPAVVK